MKELTPNNCCLILGAGRSGTSLTASLLARAGYHVYTRAHPPDDANPLGYFEDVDVINANEAILAPVWHSFMFRFSQLIKRKPHVRSTGAWLLDLQPGYLRNISLPSAEAETFNNLFTRKPFAYKDPRFSFTLAALAPIIPQETLYLCVFRDPLQVIDSTRRKAHISGINVSPEYCRSVWEAHYRCLLKHYHTLGGGWLFVNYQDILSGLSLPKIERFLQVKLDKSLIKPELNRATSGAYIRNSTTKIFEELKELSEQEIGYELEKSIPAVG